MVSHSMDWGSLISLGIMATLAIVYPFWGWLIFLRASRQRESWVYSFRAQQEAKRQKEAAALASTLDEIARAHGLTPSQPPQARD